MPKIGISFLEERTVQIGLIEQDNHLVRLEKTDCQSFKEAMDFCWKFIDKHSRSSATLGVVIPRNMDRNELHDEFRRGSESSVEVNFLGNASASYEAKFGHGIGNRHFIAISLADESIEAGVVSNGSLVGGTDGLAGNLGDMLVNAYGKLFPLTNYLSHSGIVDATTRLMANAYTESRLRETAYQNLTIEQLLDLADEKDSLALNVFDELGKVLGLKLSDIVNYFSPNLFVLSSTPSRLSHHLLKPAAKQMNKNIFNVFQGKVSVRVSDLQGEGADVIRASALV